MKKQFKLILILLTLVIALTNNVSSKNLKNEYFFKKDLSCQDYRSFKFLKCSFVKTNLEDSNFSFTEISQCNFKGANLSKTNFMNADFFKIKNLRKAKSVDGANFKGATGLKDKYKEFLRENGAINVPEDTPVKEFCEKALTKSCEAAIATTLNFAIFYGILYYYSGVK